MNLIRIFFLLFVALSGVASGQEISQPILPEEASIEAQSLGPVLTLQPGEGVTHAMQRGGCGFEYVSLVLQLSELEGADLRTLPIGTPVQLPSSCVGQPDAEIAALSEEILFGETSMAEEISSADEPSLPSRMDRRTIDESMSLAAAGFAREAEAAKKEVAVLRERNHELEAAQNRISIPDTRRMERLESELVAARMAQLYLAILAAALLLATLSGWWLNRRSFVRQAEHSEVDKRRKENDLQLAYSRVEDLEFSFREKEFQLDLATSPRSPSLEELTATLAQMGYSVIPSSQHSDWRDDFLLPSDPFAHVEAPEDLRRAS